jgi:hypothetical protein
MLCDVFDFRIKSKTLNFYSRLVEFRGCAISPATCLSLHRETQKEIGGAGTSTIKAKFATPVPVLYETRTHTILCVFLLRKVQTSLTSLSFELKAI